MGPRLRLTPSSGSGGCGSSSYWKTCGLASSTTYRLWSRGRSFIRRWWPRVFELRQEAAQYRAPLIEVPAAPHWSATPDQYDVRGADAH